MARIKPEAAIEIFQPNSTEATTANSHNSHLFSFPTLSPLCLTMLWQRTVLPGPHSSAFPELQAIPVILSSFFCINKWGLKCTLSTESIPLDIPSVMSAMKHNLSRSHILLKQLPQFWLSLQQNSLKDYLCSLLQIPIFFLEFTINRLSLPYSTKTILGELKVIVHFHVAKSNGQCSVLILIVLFVEDDRILPSLLLEHITHLTSRIPFSSWLCYLSTAHHPSLSVGRASGVRPQTSALYIYNLSDFLQSQS